MTKQNSKYLTLDQIEGMGEQSDFNLDDDSECTENGYFEPIANNLPSSSEGSE